MYMATIVDFPLYETIILNNNLPNNWQTTTTLYPYHLDKERPRLLRLYISAEISRFRSP